MNILQIDLTNYREHPTRKGFTVFFFYSEEQIEYFQALLSADNIWFEAESEVDESGKYYVAIKKSDEKKVLYLNNLVIGKFRNKFIANPLLRYTVIVGSIVILALAFIGYLKGA